MCTREQQSVQCNRMGGELYGVTHAQLGGPMQCVTRPYHATAFGWWVVIAGVLPAHLTLLLQLGQDLGGVQQSQVA